jgi:hypothetical protein
MKTEIKDMTIRLQARHAELSKIVQPKIDAIFKDLSLQMSQQKTEFESLQKDIILIKRANTEMQKELVNCYKKFLSIEQKLGFTYE